MKDHVNRITQEIEGFIRPLYPDAVTYDDEKSAGSYVARSLGDGNPLFVPNEGQGLTMEWKAKIYQHLAAPTV